MTPAEEMAAKKPPKERARKRTFPWVCNVRAVRKELGLTLHEVCEATAMSTSGLCEIERGGDLCLSTARKLADFFGKPVDGLWPNFKDEAEPTTIPTPKEEG